MKPKQIRNEDEEESQTRYSNLDTEFLKMHEPDNEDSEVLLMSPKTNEKEEDF